MSTPYPNPYPGTPNPGPAGYPQTPYPVPQADYAQPGYPAETQPGYQPLPAPPEAAKKTANGGVQIGSGVALVAVVMALMFLTDRLFWYFGLLGLVLIVTGIITIAKKK